MSTVLRVQGISKHYYLGRPRTGRSLRQVVEGLAHWPLKLARRVIRGPAAKEQPPSIWALKNISFELEEGAVLGIIGKNGSGKSTLLKIISRLTHPTTGAVEVSGRVASLLEVGVGFNYELSGRENIFLNGAILGMSTEEIESKFHRIVTFAELEQFIDTPVKHYSSGMYMRLAFSVAAHLEPDILILDEVLAVGDLDFQRRCLDKIQDIRDQNKTILLVSHAMGPIATLCSKAICLDKGQIVDIGDPEKVIQSYLNINPAAKKAENACEALPQNKAQFELPIGSHSLQLHAVSVDCENADQDRSIPSNAPFSLHVDYELAEDIGDLRLHCKLFDANEKLILHTTMPDHHKVKTPGRISAVATFPPGWIPAGQYQVEISLKSMKRSLQMLERPLHIKIVNNHMQSLGNHVMAPILEWQLTNTTAVPGETDSLVKRGGQEETNDER
jgi:lipopolysaccharide transport system ATP-binding protein